jgi:hypothetical protein
VECPVLWVFLCFFLITLKLCEFDWMATGDTVSFSVHLDRHLYRIAETALWLSEVVMTTSTAVE